MLDVQTTRMYYLLPYICIKRVQATEDIFFEAQIFEVNLDYQTTRNFDMKQKSAKNMHTEDKNIDSP